MSVRSRPVCSSSCLQSMPLLTDVTASAEIYTLSLHDALPISRGAGAGLPHRLRDPAPRHARGRSEEHTSELQSLRHLVCRLLLENKNVATVDAPDTQHSRVRDEPDMDRTTHHCVLQ